MKKLNTVIFSLLLLVVSCSDNDDEVDLENPELKGTWLLVERRPGDGSSRGFEKVDSEKQIKFFEDGTFKSNGNLCYNDTSTEENTSGAYVINDTIITQFTFDNYLVPEDCDSEYRVVLYLQVEKSSLILTYPGFEGSAQIYQKN